MESETTRKTGRKKGAKKTGGRKKGTPNRNSLSVLSALDKANIPVIELLITDIQCLEPAQRIEQWYRLMSFCYPKLKEIDYTPSIPTPQNPASTTPTANLIALVKNGNSA